ncbi:MAG TPA: bifunctional phosphoribosyl-AMP cyclohydrolase/phosphoribosyl-ATP diphosphatase HisIE [Thermotogota bacterium]|jgi:phosphoribosyl-ATP pyrophosphohydrolase/phosphoribosyl-AMP cyclohydrolase|nr:bifunctional phosphoribosyl-AMP cyclohydrolase/phosphoribosyl-ATP diphosphatase HisIE [Thermotogota bacterium]HNR63456.1 bifunctional phosphoribosyl-AMP cyclohydrolase/phosphoribosyl-ATP diphosphatase HisIE [Thermotogota bacterium]HNT94952.1 bifunctional phosphoribosyl-AMP cyclohydrolase/phosphoribosyl-ATP diphosphatase HisIE [Thermotogota bacterium]HOZ11472.1 bifunctional phosphoribosyl-AMP cyclohydrolase/phosphoribosyl-ATP diphosphatase HisIE [Thermotogota bacterium]HPH10180.1 bifunctional
MNETDRKWVDRLDWEKMNGLIPQIVQDETGVVLTLGYTNKEALDKTLDTGRVHYFSRSKNRIRMKGEISGHVQNLKNISTDCDNDALLLTVSQTGNACHTGRYSCFAIPFERVSKEASRFVPETLSALEQTIAQRKAHRSEGSYTASLFKEGKEKIYKKFGEEAVEVLVAETKDRIIYEAADMLYHFLVLLSYNNIPLEEVMKELGRRKK